MTENRKLKIDVCCYAIVSALFARMSNPSYASNVFTWEDFVDMAIHRVDLMLYIHVKLNKVNEVESKAYAAKITKEIAETLMTEFTKERK